VGGTHHFVPFCRVRSLARLPARPAGRRESSSRVSNDSFEMDRAKMRKSGIALSFAAKVARGRFRCGNGEEGRK